MKEIWKEIPGYEGMYQVSNLGNVRAMEHLVNSKGGSKRVSPAKLLSPQFREDGYSSVLLCNNGVHKKWYIHRLVAITFLDNPDNLPEINHIDENPRNNRVNNLEWCTHKYNMSCGTVPERIGSSNRGKRRSDATKALFSKQRKGKKLSEYHKLRIKEGLAKSKNKSNIK